MARLSDKHLNPSDMNTWESGDGTQKGAVVVSGVLFPHADAGRVYLMTDAGGPSVRFDIRRSDIADVSEEAKAAVIGGKPLKSIRMLLKLDAPVVRTSVHRAGGLIEYDERSATTVTGEAFKIKNTVVASATMR